MYNEDFKWLAGILIGIVLLFVLIIGWDKNQTRISCQNFGEISKRETKYVEYTYWNYACITPDKNGQWLDTKNIISID